MSKANIREYVLSLPPEQQEEWINFLDEDYNDPKNVRRMKKENSTRKKWVDRKLIKNKPYIAFDLFDGKHRHWIEEGKCMSCRVSPQGKPLETCKSENHFKYYNSHSKHKRLG